jgi:hypothetical protein
LLNRLNLPLIPHEESLRSLVAILRALANYAERQEPLNLRAKSLSNERNIMTNKLYDILIENCHALMELGLLQPIQDVVSDLVANEIENMELLSENASEYIRMVTEIKGS